MLLGLGSPALLRNLSLVRIPSSLHLARAAASEVLRACISTFFGHAEEGNKLSEKKTSFLEFYLEYLLPSPSCLLRRMHVHRHTSIWPTET